FNWEDPLNLTSQLTDEEVAIRDAARQYCQAKLFPRVLNAARKEGRTDEIFTLIFKIQIYFSFQS
ncbi:hypothetical protein HK096_009599, partial [Nowakowskiella sp. JEL0078]